jgi:hypothetical protein
MDEIFFDNHNVHPLDTGESEPAIPTSPRNPPRSPPPRHRSPDWPAYDPESPGFLTVESPVEAHNSPPAGAPSQPPVHHLNEFQALFIHYPTMR